MSDIVEQNNTIVPAKAVVDKSLSVYVGMQAELNGRELTLIPKTPINKAKQVGLELELPDSIFLGKVGDTAEDLVNSFIPDGSSKVQISDLKSGISAIDNIIDKVARAELTLSKFHVNMPSQYKRNKQGQLLDDTGAEIVDPSSSTLVMADDSYKTANPDLYRTDYTVALAATWSDEPEQDPEKMGGFNMTLKGLFVMLTNEKQDLDKLDQIIGDATKEAQKVLAPSRELNAKQLALSTEKLTAQQTKADAEKLINTLKLEKDKVDDTKKIIPTKDGINDKAKNAFNEADKLITEAQAIIDQSNETIRKIREQSDPLEKLIDSTKELAADIANLPGIKDNPSAKAGRKAGGK